MRKLNKRISIQLPEYMWKRLEQLVPELPSTTRNGAILTLLEKGMNYYAKPKGKGAPVANEAPKQESAINPVDLLDDITTENELLSPNIDETLEIARVRWVDSNN